MNKICETCDTRCRLNMCIGREGKFKYCYRKCGSAEGLEESIRPFNNINELYYILNFPVIDNSLHIETYGKNISILLGKYNLDNDVKEYPMGFIIV